MVTSLSLEGYCTSLLGVFQVYSVCGRRWGKNSVMGRLLVGDQPLGSQYPRLFTVVTDKNIPISSTLGSTRPFSWNFNFRRNLSDSEIEDLEGLMRSLDCLPLSPSVSNSRSWSLSSSGLFTVKSFFLALSQFSGFPPVFPTKPYKAISPDIFSQDGLGSPEEHFRHAVHHFRHVCWDFLDHVMEKKGFNPRWRKWIRGCLSSVSFAILVNGNAKGWVKTSRGLRQGDPLSPFLFTIVANVLSRMLLRAEERNALEGFRVGRNRTRVSHLQFADDTIFFSSTREEDLLTFKSVLLVFGHISVLKVNLDKSNIYGINLGQDHLHRLAELLDCKASGWPILYLGLPLGGNPKSGSFWDPVIERISSRLDGWQKAYLSFGGKRDHLVSWDVVCNPKTKGGLGLGRISLRNSALLGKWLWKYPREGSALWHQVILSIYGSHSNGWDANIIVRWSHRCPWKAIAQVFQDFSKFTRFMVGDEERIRFWKTCGGGINL
ncbi:putative mitochondrial protein [Vitis vinifera]|uniref:Putative mitochondrial protein n=1 Tax=Vitis vinifera TaxID=29760 RepID=A0A438IUH6_VITVI|nr:putative mitochondrial protein [Vitis vinifera]